MKNLYTARASATGGRDGIVCTDDGKLSFKLGRTDPMHGTDPEQLFACGYASCFGSAVEIAASNSIRMLALSRSALRLIWFWMTRAVFC